LNFLGKLVFKKFCCFDFIYQIYPTILLTLKHTFRLFYFSFFWGCVYPLRNIKYKIWYRNNLTYTNFPDGQHISLG
jgi:hypothetical protein